MLVIGVTGGIGSGKSTVTQRFEQLGVPVIDTDVIARQVVAPGLPAHKEVIEQFGKDYVTDAGTLDRAKLRQAVFSDPSQRKRLESILHPRIFRQMQAQLARADADYCLIVVPLLAESAREYPLDRVLVVDVPPAEQASRVARRDQQAEADVERIIASQASREKRLAIANDVIDNSGTVEELRKKVDDLHERYSLLARQRL